MSENMKEIQPLPKSDVYSEEAIETLKQEHKYMMSKISHEIRNPVTLVNSYLQLLVHEYPEISECSYWNKIMENIDLIRGLLTDLSNYNNARKIDPEETNLYHMLLSLVDSARPALESSGITINIIKQSAIPRISLDKIRIYQVFSNLIRNAAEAMPDGGTISISICCDGNNVVTSVSNTGERIPEEHQATLFQPFVTHKKEGTGLGLAIVHEIITAHNGSVSVTSNPSVPTTFTITLPVC